jgi:hypothetical protein
MIMDVRCKPVRRMFEGIQNKIMIKHETKRMGAKVAHYSNFHRKARIIQEVV